MMKIKYFGVALTTLSTSFVSLHSHALPLSFGAADDYNVFVRNNFNATSSDIEGRLAAGGNISIGNYRVNIKHGSQLYMNTSDAPALVAGGDLSFSSGQIAGNVSVSGAYNGTSHATITNGMLTQGRPSPINFDEEFDYLSELSLNLSNMSANGIADDLWSTQYLTGSGENGVGGDVHVFSLDNSDMGFSDYKLSGVDDGDTGIFNVSGNEINTSWGNFSGSDYSLFNMANSILYNFFEAELLNINAAMYGSILAPQADIFAPYVSLKVRLSHPLGPVTRK